MKEWEKRSKMFVCACLLFVCVLFGIYEDEVVAERGKRNINVFLIDW